jgi:uncharacterized protein YdhG (YjbR/CyaY superfamily)
LESDKPQNYALSKQYESLFNAASPDARQRLEVIQDIVEQHMAGMQRYVSYGMAAFYKGKVFLFCRIQTAHRNLPACQPTKDAGR